MTNQNSDQDNDLKTLIEEAVLPLSTEPEKDLMASNMLHAYMVGRRTREEVERDRNQATDLERLIQKYCNPDPEIISIKAEVVMEIFYAGYNERRSLL